MNILIADKFSQQHLHQLSAAGHQVDYKPDTTQDMLAELVGDCQVLIVRGTRVQQPAMKAAQALKLVIRAGAGTQNIDKSFAQSRGIVVCNVPGANARAVAELTIGLLVAVDRRIVDNTVSLRNGQWHKKEFSKAAGLAGKTLGLVGLGSIALYVARIAHAMGMKPLAIENAQRSADKKRQFEQWDGNFVQDLATLAQSADILSLHSPSTPETRNMINAKLLNRMPQGAILLNTARGDLIDEGALLEALDRGQLRAGLDVFADEPQIGQAPYQSKIAAHPRVVSSCHIGGSTDQAQNAVAEGCLDVIAAFEQGKILNQVNA